MKLKINETINLIEMAMSNSDAMDRCNSLGKKFVEHFIKILEAGGTSDPDFEHHCNELWTWFDLVSNIKLKSTNKLIQNSQLNDWFFTLGKNVEDIIPNPYIDIYEKFIPKVLSNRDNCDMCEILKSIIN